MALVLDCGNTAEPAHIEGMAHIGSRGYRDAVRGFETGLERDTGLPGAAENFEQA